MSPSHTTSSVDDNRGLAMVSFQNLRNQCRGTQVYVSLTRDEGRSALKLRAGGEGEEANKEIGKRKWGALHGANYFSSQ